MILREWLILINSIKSIPMKQTILTGLTWTISLLILIPSAMSQTPLKGLEDGLIKISCEGEPGVVILPNKQEELELLLKDNEPLKSLVGQLATQKLTPGLLESFLQIGRYGLGEFRRQSEGTSLALLSLVFNEKTLENVVRQAQSQWQEEMKEACAKPDNSREYIWKKP